MKKLFLFIFLSFGIYAQSAFAIMSSEEYRWGKGSGASAEEAAANAKVNLLNQIVSYVIGEVSLTKTEVNDENSSSFGGLFSSYTKTYSKLRLKNLGILQLEEEDDIYSALAYIRESDFRESVNEVKIEIREMVKMAEQKEKREGMGAAYFDYYLAYLQTFYSPEPVAYTSPLSGDSVSSVKVYLENKLRTFFSKLRLRTGVPFATPNLEEQIEIPLSVSYDERPVSKLAVRIDNADSPQRILRHGKVNLIFYSQPSRQKQQMGVILTPAFEENNELKDLHTQFALTEKSSLVADFSSLVRVDFKWNEESPVVMAFTSEIKNLSISKIEWDFGDGAVSSDLNPKHLYKNGGAFQVSLRLNSDPDLTSVKTIKVKGDKVAPPPAPPPLKEENTQALLKEEEPATDPPPLNPGKEATAEALSEQLLRAGNFQAVRDILDSFKARGLVIYGNKNAFVSPDNCYVIVIDPVTAEVKAILAPGSGQRTDLMTGKTLTDINANYKGMKMIWAEVLR